MRHPLTVATIVALSAIAHAQTTTNPAPAGPQYTVDGTLIPANFLNNQAPRGVGPGPVSNAFTYQGSLEDNGNPANAAYDMRFALLDDLNNIVAGPICIDNVAVSAGIFTVQLDFGAQFDGRARRLGIAVRPGGPVGDCATGTYTPLTPAQPLTATPYALGLRLPYSGTDNVFGGSTFAMTNQATMFSSSSAVLGVDGARPKFPFAENAGVRGESTDGIGVLGVTATDFGVVGFASGEFGYGVFGRADGPNSFAVRGFAGGADSWAGYFQGRGYFASNVGIGTTTPAANLHVNGTTRTNALRITDNAGAGRILKSNAQGDATWTPTGSNFRASNGSAPTNTIAFVSTTTTLDVAEGQRVLVTASQSFGSTFLGGGTNLDLWIAYRFEGSTTIITVGGGVFGLSVPQGQRQLFTLSAVVPLPAGIYSFGLAGRSTNSVSWNNNEWGYVTAVILP